MPHGKLIGLSPRASIFVPRYQEALILCSGLSLSLRVGCMTVYARTVHLGIHYVLFQLVLGYE